METHYAIYCAVKAVFLCSSVGNIHSPLFALNPISKCHFSYKNKTHKKSPK